ncbi:hypothetical protein GMDG_01081 [Pseudogymnoascus destructans 20631-21]|uniref:Uncharacterized protein n=1 Tax=Pseudogymnoascus destructans (strain ATCC MYA-4855 / 20631-21) TaxID=658429 RepID=L8FS72_PSED2|nr:hypothetical protein GMDG_01081 [Pseudogymnoascus destructans 20631-21]
MFQIRLRHSDLCHIGSPRVADRYLFLRRGMKKCGCAGLCTLILTLFLGGRARMVSEGGVFGGDRVLFLGRGSRELFALSFWLVDLDPVPVSRRREIAAYFSWAGEGISTRSSYSMERSMPVPNSHVVEGLSYLSAIIHVIYNGISVCFDQVSE